MTIYLNPYIRGNRRQHPLERFINEYDSDYQEQVSFPLDISAGSDKFTLKAFLPGVLPDDVNIQIVNEIVTISGELKVERSKDSEYLLAELPSGKFNRTVSLPTLLDPENVEATLDNGVLTLVIPKAEAAIPRSIPINKK